MADTVEGPLVIADISGYTAFIADTELEHSREILTELLEQVVSSLEEHLTVAQLEGDAVCFVGTETRPELLEWIEESFMAFHRRLRDITLGTTCTCRACSTVHTLTIKFVAHHGIYSWHKVGRVEQLVGTPVNVAHRLLKNHIPSHEYLFASEPVLERWPQRRGEFTPHAETYDHVGETPGGYRDLQPLREIAERPERGPVTEAEAKLSAEIPLEGSAEDAWWLLTDPRPRQIWMGAERVDIKAGARGSLVGAEFHCHHGGGETSVLKVIDLQEGRELTHSSVMNGVRTFMTCGIADDGPGRSRMAIRVAWDLGSDPALAPMDEGLKAFMGGWLATVGPQMSSLVAARHAEATPAS